MENLKAKWLIHSILGMILFGFGLSLIGEALIAKMSAHGSLVGGIWYFGIASH